MTSSQPTRWSQVGGDNSGAQYAARLAALAATGRDMHGEASFCAALVPPPARVLDAGCGTGRVAIRLAELGYRCVGADCDSSMLAEARRSPDVRWLQADLASDQLPSGFELVVVAGNVLPLLAPGTLAAAIANLRASLSPDGVLVSGFGLDAAHLPAGCPVTPLAEVDAAMAAHGLQLHERYSSWDREQFRAEAGYVVNVHRTVPLDDADRMADSAP